MRKFNQYILVAVLGACVLGLLICSFLHKYIEIFNILFSKFSVCDIIALIVYKIFCNV